VGVVIENISHSGKDNYRIQIALTNNHSEVLSLREFDRQFHVQTETGWIRLNEAPTQGSLSEKDLYFPALGKKTIVTAVEIPLNMPGLFRTYEGDISLSFRYRLVLTGDGETREHESLFWITPMTDTWLEREGM
jgi:hypothetical protein